MNVRPPSIGCLFICAWVAACGTDAERQSAEEHKDGAGGEPGRIAMSKAEAPAAAEDPTPALPASSADALDHPTGGDPPSQQPEQGPFRVGGEVEPPRRLKGPMLGEPLAEMMRSGEYAWGACIFTVTVSEHGEIGEIEFLKPQDLAPEVRSAIAETVAGWRFSPATKAGRPVPVYHTLVIHHCPHHKARTAAD